MKVCPVCREQFPLGATFCPADGQLLEDAAPTLNDDPFIGMLLDDRYQIERRLGQGGMGVVYGARHVVIDKPVAIKILRHEYCRDKGLVQRFIREARAASRIGHPNIVDVTDFGKLADGHIYFVMEHLIGVTLSQAVKNSRGLPLLRVLDLAVQMCHGLASAHQKGIVHRDLKPENIFVVNPCTNTLIGDNHGQRQDFVKLLDFGIAKFNFGQKTRITRLGSVFGTPQYMSPEQAAGEDADHRGDIYSLGCILYEMVTGEVPFTSDTFMGTLTKQMFETPVAPRQLRPDLRIPGLLEQVILKMLSKDPAERHQNMEEVSDALDRCFEAKEATSRTAPAGDAAGEPGEDATYPPGETNIDLRAKDGAELEIVPDDRPEESAPRRRREPTDAVPRLPGPRQGISIGWLALGSVLVVGLLVGGLVLWRRSVAEQRRLAALAPPPDAGVPTADAGPRLDAIKRAVTVFLHTNPQGAKILVRGQVLGKTPAQDRLLAGQTRAYTFRLRGYKDKLHTVVASAKKSPVVIVQLQRRRRVRKPRPGTSKPSVNDLMPFPTQGKRRR